MKTATPTNRSSKAHVREVIETYVPIYAAQGYPVDQMEAEIIYYRYQDVAEWRLVLPETPLHATHQGTD
jgi:hypothetical protein